MNRTSDCRNCAEEFHYPSKGGVGRPLCPKCEATYKWCPPCGYAVVRQGFHPESGMRDGLSARCKQCQSRRSRVAMRRNTPEQNRRQKLKRRYGITSAQYDTMLSEQGGACAICSVLLDRLPGGHRPHLDHDHKTGVVRGVLCPPCNKGLGHFFDAPERLLSAAAYLTRTRVVEPGWIVQAKIREG